MTHRNVWRPCKNANGHHLLTRSEIGLYWRRHWHAWRCDAKEVLYLLPADDLPQPSGGCAVSDTPCCKIRRGIFCNCFCVDSLLCSGIDAAQQENLLPGGRCASLDGHARLQVAIAAFQTTDVSDDMKVSSNHGVDGQTSISRSRPCSAIRCPHTGMIVTSKRWMCCRIAIKGTHQKSEGRGCIAWPIPS